MKTKEKRSGNNESSAVANTAGQQRSTDSAATVFADNRVETASQRKLQAVMKSHSVTQPVQRIYVGNSTKGTSREVKNTATLAQVLGWDKAKALTEVKTKVGSIIYFDEATLDGILAGSYEYIEGTSRGDIVTAVGKLYTDHFKEQRDTFSDTVGGIKDNIENSMNSDFKGLKAIYQDSEGDDGMSVSDEWSKSLACTLYALLFLKPNFLGAGSPEELHKIFRSYETTEEYDEDEVVGKIRIAAGLKYSMANAGDKVSGLVAGLGDGDRGRKIIVDMVGEAHTFTLMYDGAWKRYDNDSPGGNARVGYANKRVACTWD